MHASHRRFATRPDSSRSDAGPRQVRAPHAPQALHTPHALHAPHALPVAHAPLAGGHALEPATRSLMEQRFMHDFSAVRVHTDARAAASAHAVGALAYTVGHDIVLGARQYASTSGAGQRLIAHELAHVVQQSGAGARVQAKLPVSQPGDSHERQADMAAARVTAGQAVGAILTPAGPAIQRETPPAKPEEKEVGEVVVEGGKKIVEQLKDNHPGVAKHVIEPFVANAEKQWGSLSTGEKIGAVGMGAATIGIGAGALLSDPKGRKMLQDVNLATPFTLIPFMPLTTFKYSLPVAPTPQLRLYKFETGFDASKLINLGIKRLGLPDMSVKANLRWGYDAVSGKLTALGGDVTLGLLPGLSVTGGVYTDLLKSPDLPPAMAPGSATPGERGGAAVPTGGPLAPMQDTRVMLKLDIVKFVGWLDTLRQRRRRGAGR